MDNTQQIFPAFRLVAQFADGQRLTFDGLTEQQARQSMEAAQAQHGDITWFDGVLPSVSGRHAAGSTLIQGEASVRIPVSVIICFPNSIIGNFLPL